MNVFSSPEYLACVAEAFYPNHRYELADYEVDGRVFRLLHIFGKGLNRDTVVPFVPFMDFLEPLSSKATRKDAPDYLPSVSHGRITASEWKALLEPTLQSSPLIDFTLFPTWDAFVTFSRATEQAGFRSGRARALKKLTAESGVEFRWHDPDPTALKQLIAWKSDQYQKAGYIDGFKSQSLVRCFDLLNERGQLIITTMRVGAKIVSGHVGMSHEGRFYYWLPAYDPEWAKQGVGTMMIEWMLQQAYEKKHNEFDFLLGNENYKWAYATHTRLVGPHGKTPLRLRLWHPVRDRAMNEVRKHPAIYERLQSLKKKAAYLLMR